MKKWCLFLSVYLCLCLLAACGATGSALPGGTPSGEGQTGGETAEPALVTTVCRVVDVGDGNQLLLADTESGTIYSLPAGAAELLLEDESGGTLADWAPRAGALAEIAYDGTVLETWPAQFSGVTTVTILSEGVDDLCVLYLWVLEDLWAVDPGLNGDDLTYIGVDLSQTSLTESEQAAVAWTFAERHGGELVTGTWDELAEQGYIDKEHLQWEDGCLFTITEKPVFGSYDLKPIAFDAQKWRSGLGAYFFNSCTAAQAEDGHWGDYTVGSEAIA